MLIDVKISNFLSIGDEVILSLDSGPGKKLSENMIAISGRENLLRSAVIYGANASGKSNIIKGIHFMRNMVLNSHKFNIDSRIPVVPFKFGEKGGKKASIFEIRFIHENVRYRYGFSCTDSKVIDEYLYHRPQKRERLVFSRTNTSKYKFGSKEKKQQEQLKDQTIDNTLYLSRATQLGFEGTKKAYEFFSKYLVINYDPAWTDYTISQMSHNRQLKEKVLEILKAADFGGIEDIIIEKEQVANEGFLLKEEPFSFHKDEKEKFSVSFLHRTADNKLIGLDLSEESEGTRRTLALLGPIFDILENGKVAFIDELELSLHPSITRFLVRLFNSKKNEKNAQLIFTTHNTSLLDNELFRKDQIYFCSKEPNRNTELYSLLEYDIRQDADFERAYLTGRVGGLPFIDETAFF
ncbi:ATP-binding protein [Methanolobus zinderi]|uniref:ATP-binding protein n=1 Tax=Methanolobus zinderi TaxID=536044 RepID=A0A7D5I4Y4_9EURY|nr:ATP-binding protein [Methanolobus zinderi]QLC50064.1 ATP-binding protein [Methanolobus zinderi]